MTMRVPEVTVRALVVRQPWADSIADLTKAAEARRWRPRYRGPVLIVAGKHRGLDSLPRGVAVAVAVLDDAIPYRSRLRWMAAISEATEKKLRPTWLWCLRHAQRMKRLLPVTGRLGLFDVVVPRDAFPRRCRALRSLGLERWIG
jgi:hypothetical protein